MKTPRLSERDRFRRASSRHYAKARETALRCPWRVGRYACDGRLEITVDREGRTRSRCERCERREAGICQDCPRPVASDHRLSLRCAACKHRAILEARRRTYYNTKPQWQTIWRDRMRVFREKHPDYYRLKQQEYRLIKKRRILRGAA